MTYPHYVDQMRGKETNLMSNDLFRNRLLERIRSLGAAVAVAAALLAGCSPEESSQTSSAGVNIPIKVTCTIGMIADVVENIGGDLVEVIALMGPGVDPHLYKAAAGDNARLSGADLVFYNGLVLEGKMTDLFVALARRKPVVPVTADIERTLLLEPAMFKGHYDPHVWFDATLWMKAAATIRDTLADYDPEHSDFYSDSAKTYIGKLQELHDWCVSRAGELPADKRVLITSHDAYNYFGRAYGFEVIGVQGISTEEQATARAIVALSDIIHERKVKAVFTETSVSPKAIHAVIENCRGNGWKVVEGGQLFSDAMGSPGTPAGTYIGMVKHNMNTIVDALK